MLFKNKKIIITFLLPTLILTVVFLYYPFCKNIFNSFFKIRNWGQVGKFVGIYNYKKMIFDSSIHRALKNTLFLMVLTIIFQAGFGLLLALFVDSIKIGKKFFQTVYFFPIVVSATAIGLMFQLFYFYNGGMLNNIILSINNAFGKNIKKVYWLSENRAMTAVAIPVIWQYVGFYFVILLTAINRIPVDIYESALLDGITGFKKTIYITIPLIWDVIKVVILLAVTGSLKVFDLVWVITGGGPKDVTHLLGTYMYKVTFIIGKIGYGSTIAVLLVVVGLVISLTLNRLLKKETVTY